MVRSLWVFGTVKSNHICPLNGAVPFDYSFGLSASLTFNVPRLYSRKAPLGTLVLLIWLGSISNKFDKNNSNALS